MTRRPGEAEYASSLSRYVALVIEDDVMALLKDQPDELEDLSAGVLPGKEDYRYEPGKWNVREVLGHLSDSERVFGYRAFCVGRGERANLPGFDENSYAVQSHAGERALDEHVREFRRVREANIAFFSSLHEEDWMRTGQANGFPISVRALAFIMAGHVRHHCNILHERYATAFRH